ncbi:hypothetical protein C4D60_Mb00t04330 [Musa balbisiana]|uniref:DNA-directed RNA polymerase subunit n=1 Tax=Musa balbisiana TaxID=52838 RepID=A0A4S8I5Z6_MUSBA|nr:hypothetical protein C4D60_Mb00t04330 [Musa balbisiana]
MCQEKLVQEAVDTLLDNGIRGQPMRDGHNKVYKSFSDVIEGKEGRFRETLLGKRVDYSGRSVIVVGPSLSLHQCGLPREIAIELFQTFGHHGITIEVSRDLKDRIERYIDKPIAKKPTFLRLRGLFEYEIQSRKYSIPLFFTTQGFEAFRNREISTGAGAIREQLADSDLRIITGNSLVEWKELGEEGSTGNEWEDRKIRRRKDFLVRRMELAKHFIRTNVEPEWMVLCLLPVLPPELRPIIQIDGGKLMSSDINELYRRVIYRNNTLTDLLATSRSTPGELVMCQEKLVQEAVDTLLDNGIRGQPMRDGHNKVYKSFSDVIEGKEGRFRETLLGKRVDYSGRSVIVVGPSLSLHQCGLPREIAIELFQTFVIRGLIRQHVASNIGIAKSKIREKEPIVWEILQEVMRGHPVLLNRAPTLHRLGIQAFQPFLVEGRAICLHPLVCKGFNADFDGDQMAVHVPLSLEAQAEARLLMFSHMNLLSPAIGDPISVPTQDMLIGLYLLTIGNLRGISKSRNLYRSRCYQRTISRFRFANYYR